MRDRYIIRVSDISYYSLQSWKSQCQVSTAINSDLARQRAHRPARQPAWSVTGVHLCVNNCYKNKNRLTLCCVCHEAHVAQEAGGRMDPKPHWGPSEHARAWDRRHSLAMGRFGPPPRGRARPFGGKIVVIAVTSGTRCNMQKSGEPCHLSPTFCCESCGGHD